MITQRHDEQLFLDNPSTPPMLSTLLQELHKHTTPHGIFITGYDADHQVTFSQGSFSEDASTTLTSIYETHITWSSTQILTLHIITDLSSESPKNIQNIDLTQKGIAIHDEDEDYGVILPGTTGITTITEALSALKKKASLHGKSHINTFQTTNITYTLPTT